MFSAVVGCPDGVYANWTPQLDIFYVHLGSYSYYLDILGGLSRLQLDTLRETR
jgi:hypothetical protein